MRTRRKKIKQAKKYLLSLLIIVASIFGISTYLQANAEDTTIPKHTKNYTDNGDGTYTLHLDVKGSNEKNNSKANVIIIYDVSGSMRYYIESSTGRWGTTSDKTIPWVNDSNGYDDRITLYKENGEQVTTDDYDGDVYTRSTEGYGYNAHYVYKLYTGKRYSNELRVKTASEATKSLSDSLLNYNTKEGNDPDTVEMALVTFSSNATKHDFDSSYNKTNYWTTNKTTFSNAVPSTQSQVTGGTNWEAALSAAYDLATAKKAAEKTSNGKADPTYVIFVTDGDPTLYNNGYSTGGNGNDLDEANVKASYDKAAPYAKAIVEGDSNTGGNKLYTVGIYGSVTRMKDLTDYAYGGTEGAGDGYYFPASDTASLNQAFAQILSEIERVGVGNVSISDGTTQKVTTSTGTKTYDLLHVDESSYRYTITFPIEENGKVLINDIEATITTENGVSTLTWTEDEETKSITGKVENNTFVYNWTEKNDLYDFDPPRAELKDGAVDWDLSKLKTLLNNVTYTIYFDVWPSQTTYDLISDLDNGIETYDNLDSEVRKYLIKDGNSYVLKTNTQAKLIFSDPRYNYVNKEESYNDPDPVATDVSKIKVKKEWDNKLDTKTQNTAKLYVTKDGKDYGIIKKETNPETGKVTETIEPVEVSSPDWEEEMYISTGLISLVKENDVIVSAIIRESGHDYSFREDSSAYNWELEVQKTRPMVVDKTLMNLKKVEKDAPTIGDTNVIVENGKPKYFKIDGEVYEVMDTEAVIKATNVRRSNLNLAKVVTGDTNAIPKDAVFEFKLKVNDVNNDDLWFSIAPLDDPDNIIKDQKVKNGEEEVNIVSGTGVVYESTGTSEGYYHVKSGTELTINLKANWNVRFTNLPQGTTYEVEEKNMDDTFYFVKNTIEEEQEKPNHTSNKVFESTTNKITNKTIDKKNISYQVTYTNEYSLTEVNGKKIWNDNNNQDGKRPTSITIELHNNLQDDAVASKTLTKEDADKDGNWIYSFTDLPYKNNGEVIKYSTVEITQIDGYTTTQDGFNITNTHTPEKIEVSVKKVWDDANNQDAKRPTSIDVLLEKVTSETNEEGITTTTETLIGTVTLNEANGWTSKIENLPKYENGTEIEYKWVEKDLSKEYELTNTEEEGYTVTNTQTEGKLTTLTNTHTPATTEASVKKVWDDANNQDGKRPASLKVTLSNGTEVTLNAGNQWTAKVENLPKYANGTEINYTWTEAALPEGYTLTDTSKTGTLTTITNTYTPETTEASVKKVWNDAENQDGKRPASLKVTLSNGTEVTLNAGNQWTAKVENLPKYANGTEINYTWTEAALPEGYTLTDTSKTGTLTTLTNSYTPETTEASVKKVWDDANNQDGKRPASLKVTLSNGTEVTLNEANGWTAKVENLPKYANGTEINYTWTEAALPEGYTLTDTSKTGTLTTLTNSYTPETTEASVKKVWDDANNQDGKRPASLKVTLSNGTEVTLNEANGWTAKVENLPKYADGKEIAYTWTEDTLPAGYTLTDTSKTGTLTTITNTHTPELTEASVKKVWDDANNQDGKRPESLKVTLSNGTEVTLNEANGWTAKVENLPKYAKGKEIAYTWTEEELPKGYTLTDTSKTGTLTTITNTHTPETTEASVKKVWDDANNQDGKRPTSLKVTLSNGTEVTLNEANGWTAKVENLPKYAKGIEVSYTWTEEKLPEGYALASMEKTGTLTTITNTHATETTEASVKKVWDDANNQDGKRPSSLKVTLSNGAEVTLNEANGWTATVKDLPKYANGKEIAYTWTEDTLPKGYTLTDTSKTGTLTTLTNTHTPELTEASVKKVWDDANNQDGKRPASLKVTLSNGTEVTLNEANGWTAKVENLPKYANGKEIAYTWTEEELPKGYKLTGNTTEGTLTTLTNSHTPELIDVTINKVWRDTNNVQGKRFDVELSLLGNDKEVGKVTLKVSDDKWTHTFTNLPKYAGGKEITYKVKENNSSEFYDKYEDGLTVINTIKDLNKDIPVTKIWNDADDQDGARNTIEVHLEGKIGNDIAHSDTIRISKEDVDNNNPNKWLGVFKNVPTFKDGSLIAYNITEKELDKDGNVIKESDSVYTTVIEGNSTDGYEITNTHIPELVDIEGTKIWDDADDQDGKRPDSITVELYNNISDTYVKSIEVTKDNIDDKGNWTILFKDLPKYHNHGEEIIYTLKEVLDETTSKYYESTIESKTITNTHTPATITYNLTKNWDDLDDQDGIRPTSIVINIVGKITIDGKEEVVVTRPPITITGENTDEKGNWLYTIDNLPKYWNKQLVQYTITESEVKGYQTGTIVPVENKEEDTSLSNEITNTHTPKTTEIEGTKTWEDNNDQDGKRPESIKVTIIGKVGTDKVYEETKEVTPDEEGNWLYKFTDLPVFFNHGNKVIYSISELDIPEYTSQTNGYNLINTHIPELISINGEKVWEDENNINNKRPNEISVKLYANGEYQTTFTVSSKDDWKYIIENLPKYKDGEEIVYTIEEEIPDYYVAAYDGFKIINTLIGKGGDEEIEELPPQTGINNKGIDITFLIGLLILSLKKLFA